MASILSYLQTIRLGFQTKQLNSNNIRNKFAMRADILLIASKYSVYIFEDLHNTCGVYFVHIYQHVCYIGTYHSHVFFGIIYLPNICIS